MVSGPRNWGRRNGPEQAQFSAVTCQRRVEIQMIPAEENGLDRELVLFIGRVNDPAWKEQMQWLRKVCELVCCATIPAAEKWLVDTSRFPGIIVFSQPRRDYYNPEKVQHLVEQLPMARAVSVEGSWCEGESRSGHPYKGVQHFFWHQFQPRMAELLGHDATGAGTRTETENDRAITASGNPLPEGTGLLGIVTSRLVTYEALGHACRQAGYRTTWLRTGTVDVPRGLRAIIVDVGDLGDAEEVLAGLPDQASVTPRVVLAGFPRLADVKRLAADGRTKVVAKPFRLHDLLWLLADCIKDATSDRAA